MQSNHDLIPIRIKVGFGIFYDVFGVGGVIVVVLLEVGVGVVVGIVYCVGRQGAWELSERLEGVAGRRVGGGVGGLRLALSLP